jgi:hypothetical protein
MLPPAADRPKLKTVLDHLAASVEELLLGGLTTASESTRQTLSVALQEAARFRLLRLGATLRVVVEDLGRFTSQDPLFSRRRLAFFLNRTWLLSRGIAHALGTADEKQYDRLTFAPPSQALSAVEVVCLGVVKRVARANGVFDFRLRAVADSGPVRAGQRLSWSLVFTIPQVALLEFPPEFFLDDSMKSKQIFKPRIFLQNITVVVRDASLSVDDSGGGRVVLTDSSTVAAGKPFHDWARFLDWSPAPAATRLKGHSPGPLDLDTELQEEVVLRDYEVGPPADGEEPGQTVYPVSAGPLPLHAVVGPDPEGKALRKGLDDLRKKKKDRPPLFGLLHYERCRLVLQPLTAFNDGPDYLTISNEVVNKAALLKAMSFT